jgi:4-amino-4-deoxy-L-arabinose transferase-like glycosyltransferase
MVVKSHAKPHLKPLAGVLLAALVLRAALLSAGAFTFNADEAVVASMARHILQGREFPVFFYGQAYMGSLDALLVAGGFTVFGESVLVVRLVQSALYMGVVATTYWLGWRLTGRRWAASVAGLIAAVPPAVMTLYTTATLGGYNETLLLGNLILLYSYEVTHGREESWWRWACIGAAAGLGWWTNGLIVVYLAPAGLLILRHASVRRVPRYLLAFACFMLLSAPWWAYNIDHDNAAIEVFLAGRRADSTGFDVAPAHERLLGLLFIGLPSAIGLRYPWSGSYFAMPLAVLVLIFYVGMVVYWVRGRGPRMAKDARGLLMMMLGLFCVIFVASTFGTDPTGRYFLPIIPPLAVLTAAALGELRVTNRWLYNGAAIALLGFFLAGNVIAAVRQPPGFTTQFDSVSHIPHDDDQALIDFLQAHDLTRGYSNYWVAFRFTFLTDEAVILRSALPYKEDLSYNSADDRYPPYRDAVEAAPADAVFYITTNLPQLDAIMRERLAAAGVTFDEAEIGVYHVFYGLSAHVTPEALGLDRLDAEQRDAGGVPGILCS